MGRQPQERTRLGTPDQGSQRLRAERPKQVWSYDFVQDQTREGRRLKILAWWMNTPGRGWRSTWRDGSVQRT